MATDLESATAIVKLTSRPSVLSYIVNGGVDGFKKVVWFTHYNTNANASNALNTAEFFIHDALDETGRRVNAILISESSLIGLKHRVGERTSIGELVEGFSKDIIDRKFEWNNIIPGKTHHILPPNFATCVDLARLSVVIQGDGTVSFKIPQAAEGYLTAIILGLCAVIIEKQEPFEEIFKNMVKSGKCRIEERPDALNEIRSNFTRASVHNDGSGYYRLPIEHKIALWFIIMNPRLKTGATLDRHNTMLNKRIETINKMGSIAIKVDFKMTESLLKAMNATVLDYGEIYGEFLKATIATAGSGNDERFYSMALKIASGVEMSSIDTIKSFLNSTIKTQAHIMNEILEDIVKYKEAVTKIEVESNAGQFDMKFYKLMKPGSDLPGVKNFNRLLVAAIVFDTKFNKQGHWAGYKFGTVENEAGIRQAASTKIMVTKSHVIPVHLRDVAKDIGIPLDDEGKVKLLKRRHQEDDEEIEE